IRADNCGIRESFGGVPWAFHEVGVYFKYSFSSYYAEPCAPMLSADDCACSVACRCVSKNLKIREN
ncbi:MAG: hypothetical protein Q4E49_05905, partial [Bacteroidales bacterium]|nr:hypothetical protein [Bacteroidales bacterium]